MKNISPKHRVLDHIDHVRDWLDRAEDGYVNGASMQGEMNLNLAQAELKKAWEESRNMHKEAQAMNKVVSLPQRPPKPVTASAPVRPESHGTAEMSAPAQPVVEQGVRVLPKADSQPVAMRKRSALLVQHRFGLVAAVVLLLVMNIIPWLQGGIPFEQTLISGANPMNESPVTDDEKRMEEVLFKEDHQTIAYAKPFTDLAVTTEARAAADGLPGDSRAEQRSTPTNRTGSESSRTRAKVRQADAITDSDVNSETSFRFSVNKGQMADTPTKEVNSQAQPPTSINRSIALNAKTLRSSGNRVDTILASETTGTVKAIPDSTPARSNGTGIAITATNTASRTGDSKDVNLALSQTGVSIDTTAVNVNSTWSTVPAFSYSTYSNATGSSSQSTVSNINIAKSGVKLGSTASNTAAISFDLDTLVDLASQVLYTNQQ